MIVPVTDPSRTADLESGPHPPDRASGAGRGEASPDGTDSRGDRSACVTPSTPGEPRLRADGLSLAYDRRTVVEELSIDLPDQSFTVIVGANACGKSTLLRGLARLLKPAQGTVLLDGADIQRRSTRQVAATLGILPQQPVAPEGITVGDLVARGRHPHQRLFRQWSRADEAAVRLALEATATAAFTEASLGPFSVSASRSWDSPPV